MDALDGNAIAGLLEEVFGRDMTTAWGACAHCGARLQLAESVVYLHAPGVVVRCRRCERVLMVFVQVRETRCVDLMGLERLT
jgi:hypothetical protein